MKKLFSATLCVAVIGWAGTASALSIVNGSFETGTTAGWDVQTINGSGVSIVTSATAYDSTVYLAADGNYFADISATAYLLEGQSWSAGETISFSWAFLGNDYLPFNDSAVFQVTNYSGTILSSVTLADIGSVGDFGDTGWNTYTFTFANAGTGIIKFGAINDGDNALASKLLLDKVTTAAPVPEPTTMLLFGTGLIGLAAAGRRRTASKG